VNLALTVLPLVLLVAIAVLLYNVGRPPRERTP
jgi:hypothetical protein